MVQDVFQYCFKQDKVSKISTSKSEAHKQKKTENASVLRSNII